MASIEAEATRHAPSTAEEAVLAGPCMRSINHVIGIPMWQAPEHKYIAQQVKLRGRTNADASFIFANGLKLTYDQIHFLAGDFYGTNEPISLAGKDKQPGDAPTRFLEAYDTLTAKDSNKDKAEKLLYQIKVEDDYITDYVNSGKGTAKQAWEAWRNKDLVELEDDSTIGQPTTGLDYKGLLKINVDHFGPNARQAYAVGHRVAIDTARAGDLETAYAQNGFAEHFLQDDFASGHLRVPREYMMDSYAKGICANLMHNEDNNNGLKLKPAQWPNPEGISPAPIHPIFYMAYGDDSLHEADNKTNLEHAVYALQVSADEVYEAYQNPKDSKWDSPTFSPRAFDYVATQESITSEDNPCPMFWLVGNEVQMRSGLVDVPPTPIAPGKWQFETVVQKKVLPKKYIPEWLQDLVWELLTIEQRTEVCWASVAYYAAPNDFYSSIALDYLLGLLKKYLGIGWFMANVQPQIEALRLQGK